MSSAGLTGPHSETTQTQEQDGSLSLDHNTHSQSPFDRHPETNHTGLLPLYNDSINNESYYSVQSQQPQPQPHDTRFDGSHSDTEHRQELETSHYLDSNTHSKSGAYPLINYSQEPVHELHVAYEPCYDGVQTQQPQPYKHRTNNVDNSHDYKCKCEDCAEDRADFSGSDCEDCCETFCDCLKICEICFADDD